MTDRISKSRALKEDIRTWAARQCEPFDTVDVRGRFGIVDRTATKYLAQMVADGLIRVVATQSFGNGRRYERVRR